MIKIINLSTQHKYLDIDLIIQDCLIFQLFYFQHSIEIKPTKTTNQKDVVCETKKKII